MSYNMFSCTNAAFSVEAINLVYVLLTGIHHGTFRSRFENAPKNFVEGGNTQILTPKTGEDVRVTEQ